MDVKAKFRYILFSHVDGRPLGGMLDCVAVGTELKHVRELYFELKANHDNTHVFDLQEWSNVEMDNV